MTSRCLVESWLYMWNVIVNDTNILVIIIIIITLIRGSVELMWTQSPTISHKFINTSNTESFLKCDSSKNHKMAHGAILWFFKESHLRKLWPSYDCYFEFGKSSEVQNKSQMRKLSWMPNVFLNPIQKKFLLKFFLTAFENEAHCSCWFWKKSSITSANRQSVEQKRFILPVQYQHHKPEQAARLYCYYNGLNILLYISLALVLILSPYITYHRPSNWNHGYGHGFLFGTVETFENLWPFGNSKQALRDGSWATCTKMCSK